MEVPGVFSTEYRRVSKEYPLPRRDRGFDGLHRAAGLNVMINRSVHLLLAHEVVAPLLLQRYHLRRKHRPRQINGAPVHATLAVRLQRALVHLHLLKQLARAAMQPHRSQRRRHALHDLGRLGQVRTLADDLGSPRRHARLEELRNGAVRIAWQRVSMKTFG